MLDGFPPMEWRGGRRTRLPSGAMESWVRRLLVVDDEPLVTTLIAETLSGRGFEVRTAAGVGTARELIDAFDPDAAVLDIHLGAGPSGLHFGQALHRSHPHIGLVFLTKYHDSSAGGMDAWDVPAESAFLAKDQISDAGSLIEAIEMVLRNEPARDDRTAGPLSVLTSTQREILRLVAMGLTNAAIAQRRSTMERTVEKRLQAIYLALGIPVTGEKNPRMEAARLYIQAAGIPNDMPNVAPH